LEPNGGKLKELLMELFRVTADKLILFEPCYEINTQEGKDRMDKLGYIKNIEGVVGELGGKVIDKIVVKIGDYGLSKAFDMAGLFGQTLTGTKMGTPVFMPRQQVLNFKDELPEIDIWATAACLYNMLTGYFPRNFTGDPWLSVLQNSPVPILQRHHGIPQKLAKVIDLALQEKPQIYFQTAAEFKQALLDCS
jgi:serine/threonine protein kinase